MNTGAAALSQIQTRYDTASLPIERETWPQGMSPAENVATSKPLGAAHRPKKKGRGLGLWSGDALGIPVSNCMLGDKRTQLKKSLALADRVMRLQAAAQGSLIKNLGSGGRIVLYDMEPFPSCIAYWANNAAVQPKTFLLTALCCVIAATNATVPKWERRHAKASRRSGISDVDVRTLRFRAGQCRRGQSEFSA
jgi:hypothetical protein